MKAAILDGTLPGAATADRLLAEVRGRLEQAGWEVRLLRLRDMAVAACLGCFGCWVRTPGQCVVDDDGQLVAREVIRSDLAVFATPVTFGGYSSELKKGVDRLIPLGSPFFRNVGGETHHRRRYRRYPALLGFGLLRTEETEEAALFRRLVERNALNLHSPRWFAEVLAEDDPALGARVRTALASVGVNP